jgi:hypothetical protein
VQSNKETSKIGLAVFTPQIVSDGR